MEPANRPAGNKLFEIVYLDLDGVLANFIKGACSVHGKDYEETLFAYHRHHLSGRPLWGLEDVWGDPSFDPWPAIRAVPGFWAELEPYPWAKSVFVAASLLGEKLRILTSPIACPNCYAGKFEWVRRHVGGGVEFIPFAAKEELSAPGRLLIDDNDGNVSRFRQRGGHAFLFPQPWNYCDPQDIVNEHSRIACLDRFVMRAALHFG